MRSSINIGLVLRILARALLVSYIGIMIYLRERAPHVNKNDYIICLNWVNRFFVFLGKDLP